MEHQNQLYELHHYIAGDLCDVARPTHWAVAVSTLASYHHLVDGFDHPALHWPRERYGPTALAKIIERILQAWQAQMQGELQVWRARLEGHAQDLAVRFSEFRELPQLVIHGDYYAENLIFQGDRLAALVDYDLAHRCFRAMELAEAQIYFATERPARLKHIVYSGVLDLQAVLPFMVLPLYAAIEKLDPLLVEAARDLGAGWLRAFVRLVIPLTLPGIVAGSMLVFLPALGMFYIPDLLGGARTLLVGSLIRNQFLAARDWPFGAALSVVLTVVMALLLLVYVRSRRLTHREDLP